MTQPKIYITGAVISRSVDQLHEFALAEEKLSALGFSVTTATTDLPVGDHFNNLAAQDEWRKRRKQYLLDAAIVLWLYDYAQDELAIVEVRSALAMNKEKVMLASDFINTYTAKVPDEVAN